MEEAPRWSRYCPAGLRRFREAYGAAGPRRDLFRKAQPDKPHDLVTPSTIAAQLRRSHRAAYKTPASRPTGSSSASAMGCGAPLTPPIEKPSSCVHSAADLKAVFTGEPRANRLASFYGAVPMGVSTYEVPIQTPGENAARRLR
jgi:hypothetical protein